MDFSKSVITVLLLIELFVLKLVICGRVQHAYSKDFNENRQIETINEAFLKYKACDVSDCSCFQFVIDNDLAAFNGTGISKRMFDRVSKRGVKYQIFDHKLYRYKNCMFPSRCSGIEHFLLRILDHLPNTEMIVNVRDYPQIMSKSDNEFGPVFSFSKTNDYFDIMYPAWSFWQGGPATKLYPTGIGRWDLHRKSIKLEAETLHWDQKVTKGFFRGSRTSPERDTLIRLSQKYPDLIEANYTKNQAWKSVKDTLNMDPVDEVSFEYHCRYKYLFNFRGVAASFRLRHLFMCKSLVFHVGHEWVEFFYPLLKPWVHYIPIDSNYDPSDLVELLKFFQNHDTFATKIANQGYHVIWKHLRLSTIECYWKRLIIQYSKLLNYSIKKDDNLIEIH